MNYIKNERPAPSKNEQTGATMTSLQIAEVTGKPHYNVLKSIRRMEPA
jgi:phage regulator Rha-like protein